MKKTVLLSGLALTAFAFADGDLIANYQQGKGQNQQQASQMPSVVSLTSARPESDNGWYVFGDVLYWHADVGQTDWASKLADSGALPSNTGHPRSIEMHSLNFKWSWGFKAGIGVNMDHDMWDSNLYYTWFQTQNSNQAGVDPALGDVVDNIGSLDGYSSAKIKWTIHYSMFDWELGRDHYASKNLALRPHVGVKGGWINQNVRVVGRDADSEFFDTLNEKFKNDFWGVGPSVGINTMWILGSAGTALDHRFALFGDFGGALMYGHYRVTFRQIARNDNGSMTNQSIAIRNLNRNRAATMLQGIMGFSWDTAFNRGRNHFMMKVGYELQYWFRQNQMVWATDTTPDVVRRYSDDLALQGLTTEIRFDF